MTIRQREPLIKHRGDTETLREVSMSFNDFVRENSTCQYKHAGKMLIAMLRTVALTAERALAKQIDFVESRGGGKRKLKVLASGKARQESLPSAEACYSRHRGP